MNLKKNGKIETETLPGKNETICSQTRTTASFFYNWHKIGITDFKESNRKYDSFKIHETRITAIHFDTVVVGKRRRSCRKRASSLSFLREGNRYKQEDMHQPRTPGVNWF